MIGLLFFMLFQAGVTSNATVSGTVIEAERVYSVPLFHARVELGIDNTVLKVTRTDENGRFAFLGLPPGTYYLSVTDEGFIRKTKTITLTEGQSQTDLQFSLNAAPTIIGHIKDQSGSSISNLIVEAMKSVYGPRGDKSLASVAASLTDDHGEYHIYWLDPGDYIIRAALPGTESSDTAQERQPALPYPPTYFPGFRDPDDAKSIRIGAGTVTNAVDFTLQAAPPVAVGGIVTLESNGEPVGSIVTLNPVSGAAGTRQHTRSLDNSPGVPLKMRGSFVFEGVPPGTYMLSAETGTADNRQNGSTRVQLSDRADQSVTLKLRSGSDVSGQMVQESGGKLDLRLVRVELQSIDPALTSPSAVSADAGKFTLRAVPAGSYAVVIRGLPENTYVKTARSGSLDVLANALRIEGTSQTIQIVLGMDGGSINGIVMDNASRPIPDAQVILVPDTPRRNRANDYLTDTSDDSGQFTIKGIPPGAYKLFGWQNIEENAYKNPRFLQDYESLGMSITVPPRGIGTVSVPLIPMN